MQSFFMVANYLESGISKSYFHLFVWVPSSASQPCTILVNNTVPCVEFGEVAG
jgi:hypothetical protein